MVVYKSATAIKKLIAKGIPRQAIACCYCLRNQFSLLETVTLVEYSGGVPLSVIGAVIDCNISNIACHVLSHRTPFLKLIMSYGRSHQAEIIKSEVLIKFCVALSSL